MSRHSQSPRARGRGRRVARPVEAADRTGLEGQARRLKIIEADRQRAEELAARFPEVRHRARRRHRHVRAGVRRSGQDATRLPGPDGTRRGEPDGLPPRAGARRPPARRRWCRRARPRPCGARWRCMDVVSPRTIAAERIRSLHRQQLRAAHRLVRERRRRVRPAHRGTRAERRRRAGGSPTMEIPQGLIVAAILRNGRADDPARRRPARGRRRGDPVRPQAPRWIWRSSCSRGRD